LRAKTLKKKLIKLILQWYGHKLHMGKHKISFRIKNMKMCRAETKWEKV
jgi:hypothetical protein